MSVADDFVTDVKYAARLHLRSPGLAVVVLATLAIAIGATITIFSIVDAWLIRPLNFPDAKRLVIAFGARPDRPSEPAVWLPYREYLGWKERSRSFASLSAAFLHDATVTSSRDAQSALGLSVTPEFFRTLGVEPLLGRTISEEDTNGPPAVVLSHGFWQRHFGGSDRVVGEGVLMNGVPHQILGVMPRDFDVRMLDMRFEYWIPLRAGDAGYRPGGSGPVTVLGRLRDSVSIESARSEVAAIARDIESHYEPNFLGYIANLSPLQLDNTRHVRATLLTIAAAVVCLLLMTAINVGSLLLGRSIGRIRETSIRAAIGCSRRRLVRQFLTESLVMAVTGAIAGVGLAALAVRSFVAWNPLGALPANPIALNLRTFVAAGLAAAVATVVSGVAPAWRAASADPNETLQRGTSRGTSAPARGAQLALLITQIATCVVLLVATALMVRTFVRLQEEPLGFSSNGLFVANVIIPKVPSDTNDQRIQYFTRLSDRLRGLPGVRAVAAGTSRPLSSGALVTVNTEPADSINAPRINGQAVTSGFFATLDIPVVAGRAFDERDNATGAPVAILNVRAAQDLFGSAAAALGRRVRVDKEPWREVVGVVGNVRSTFFNTLEWTTNPVVYRPDAQVLNTLDPSAAAFGFQLHIRSERPLTMDDVRNTAFAVSSRAAVTELLSVPQLVHDATRQPAFRMTLLLGFSVVSLLLAAIGTFGLMSQTVTHGARDIAIRLALGADPRRLAGAIVLESLMAASAGLTIGAIASLLVGNAMKAMVYGVRPGDALSFFAAGVTLLFVTAVGALIPALRTIAVDPATVLRAD